jgi:hypothetical protein
MYRDLTSDVAEIKKQRHIQLTSAGMETFAVTDNSRGSGTVQIRAAKARRCTVPKLAYLVV